jgi:hypothetical protein
VGSRGAWAFDSGCLEVRLATVGDIAARAGVSVDTVCGAVGRKPVLLKELVESALNAPEYWVLPVHERGRPPARFQEWITDAWTTSLLRG